MSRRTQAERLADLGVKACLGSDIPTDSKNKEEARLQFHQRYNPDPDHGEDQGQLRGRHQSHRCWSCHARKHVIPVSDSREVFDTYIVFETVSVSSIFEQGKFHHVPLRKKADEEYVRRRGAAASRVN